MHIPLPMTLMPPELFCFFPTWKNHSVAAGNAKEENLLESLWPVMDSVAISEKINQVRYQEIAAIADLVNTQTAP